MIRNAVVHLLNEQPLLADLFERPSGAEVSLVCTNLRTTNGRAPVFVDDQHAVFVFPFAQIRFLEIPSAVAGERGAADDAREGSLPGAAGGRANGAGAGPADEDPDAELELDEDFLRRIREV